jgi:hypothetical protein
MVKALFSSWLRNNYSTFYASILFSVVVALIPARGLTQVVATPPTRSRPLRPHQEV